MSYKTIYSTLPHRISEKFQFGSGLLWNFLIFGAPLWIIFNLGFWGRVIWYLDDPILEWSLYLSSLWIMMGPILVYIWENQFSKFITEYKARVDEDSNFRSVNIELVEYTIKKIDATSTKFGASFSVIGLIGIIGSYPVLRNTFGVQSQFDILMLSTIIVVIGTCYASGIGVWGVVKMIVTIVATSKTKLSWQPYHKDQLGGLSFIGDFSLITAIIFSAGSVVVPITLQKANQLSGLASIWLISVVVFYSVSIISSFLVPILFVSAMAKKSKESQLAKISEAINSVLSPFLRGDSTKHTKGKLVDEKDKIEAIEPLIKQYERLSQMSIYPFTLSTMIRLSMSGLAPLFFFALEKAVSYWLGQ